VDHQQLQQLIADIEGDLAEGINPWGNYDVDFQESRGPNSIAVIRADGRREFQRSDIPTREDAIREALKVTNELDQAQRVNRPPPPPHPD